MAESKNPRPQTEDPRHRMAQRYLQAAHDDLAAKESAQPYSQRKRRTGEPEISSLVPSIALSTVLHAVLLMVAVTATLFACLWCYILLNHAFIAGRVVALPTGVVFFATASYASACYLGILESTSHGHTSPDNMLDGGWQDWFWTLPTTLGMLGAAALAGYAFSLLASNNQLTIIVAFIWLLYPIFQLSTLEAGSPMSPISLPILRSLVTHPVAWLVFYMNSFALLAGFAAISYFVWRDPPFLTVLIVGPIAAVAMLTYAWLVGQLARWLTIKGK